MPRKRKRKSFKLKGKKHSVKGVISLLIACLIIIVFIIISVLSSQTGGNGGLELGIVGVLCFIAAIIGFILGYTGFKEKDIYYAAPILGVILNGLLFILHMSLYIIGVLS